MEEADEPPLSRFTDRVHSTARSTASDRGPSTRSESPHPYSAARNSVTTSSKPLKSSPLADNGRHTRHADGNRVNGEPKAHNVVPDVRPANPPPPAPPPANAQLDSEKDTALAGAEKPPWPQRIKAGSKRFMIHFKDAIFHSWMNLLLLFVPLGIAMEFAPLPGHAKPTIVFSLNAIAIIPLAGLLAHATECVAGSMGDTWASLLNVTFGNAVELIIFIIALAKDQITTVQAAIMGSILANLLLILGMAFLCGGLRFQEQIYNSTVTQMSACLLSLSVVSLLLPTAFHASFSDNVNADAATTKISRGTSVILLIIYVLYLLFQLKSHAYLYASTPQHIIDEESHPGLLADIMSSSSSDSSSSSSDTDSSLGSHATAKKRFKRAVKKRMRRKSSASSTTAGSPPSANMSVIDEKKSSRDDQTSSPSQEGGYFDLPRTNTQASAGAIFSGDEADTDGENDRGFTSPHVRDFEAEHGGSSKHSAKSIRKRKHRKPKRKGRKYAKDGQSRTKETVAISDGPASTVEQERHQPHLRVEFKEESDKEDAPAGTSARRGFTRQVSRPMFRPPPLPSLLSNTVFTNAPPAARTPGQTAQPAPFSIAHRSVAHRSAGLRRTSSLPDRLDRPVSTRGASQAGRSSDAANNAAHRAPGLAPNVADVAREDREEEGKKPAMSRTAAVVLLLCTTGLVAFCAELAVDVIPEMVEDTTVSLAFIGLIVLPIVGNAAEHVTAVVVASKNKMDLAIGVAVGSSIQIALFVTPVVVLLGWIMGKEMSLYFNLFETVSLFVTAFVINFLILDGRSNYLEGSLLIAAYVIIAVAAFFYPNTGDQSQLGGGDGPEIVRRLMMG